MATNEKGELKCSKENKRARWQSRNAFGVRVHSCDKAGMQVKEEGKLQELIRKQLAPS